MLADLQPGLPLHAGPGRHNWEGTKLSFYIFVREIFLENIAWNLPACAAFKGKDDLPGIVVEVSNERINEENSTIDLLAFLCYLLDYFSFPFRKIKKYEFLFFFSFFNCTQVLTFS